MLIEIPKLLPENLDMLCYACENAPATHLCRYKVGELVIQMCLCGSCMKIDTKRLLENTVGIEDRPICRPPDDLDHADKSDRKTTARSAWSV